jgi:hypothetical protein
VLLARRKPSIGRARVRRVQFWSSNSGVPRGRANRPAGESPAPASRQRSGEANSPAWGESPASKPGGAKLQAVMNMNSAASKELPVRDREGRARHNWAKAAVRALDSGAARNLSGVSEAACSEGRLVNWGGLTAPDGEIDRRGSRHRYKAKTESRGGAEGVGAGHSTEDRRDNRTRRRKGPALR